jgi:hypothetical protein
MADERDAKGRFLTRPANSGPKKGDKRRETLVREHAEARGVALLILVVAVPEPPRLPGTNRPAQLWCRASSSGEIPRAFQCFERPRIAPPRQQLPPGADV